MKQGFRRAIETLSLKTLQEGLKTVDYRALVDAQWRRQGMDDLLAKRVDVAIEEVRSETSWAGLAQTLINSEKAQAISTAVAERVYHSDAMKTAIESLVTGVGNDVGRTLELASTDAIAPSLECLRAFLGNRYGSTVTGIVSADVEHDFGVNTAAGRATISSGAVVSQSSEGIAGAALASGSPPARKHRGASGPALGRQYRGASGLGRRRRRRPRAGRQGHLGAAQRRASHHRRGNEVRCHQKHG